MARRRTRSTSSSTPSRQQIQYPKLFHARPSGRVFALRKLLFNFEFSILNFEF